MEEHLLCISSCLSDQDESIVELAFQTTGHIVSEYPLSSVQWEHSTTQLEVCSEIAPSVRLLACHGLYQVLPRSRVSDSITIIIIL